MDRTHTINFIKDFLINFDKNKSNLLYSRGLYIYGSTGTGKTQLVKNILTEMNYDIIYYDSSDVRNKDVINTINNFNISEKNILSIFQKNTRKNAIVMDEIDGMSSSDKGGIDALVKLIRPKKTKKQKAENFITVPIICIGNYYKDKKISELISVCKVIELKQPTNLEIRQLVLNQYPTLFDNTTLNNIVEYVCNDLRKLSVVLKLIESNPDIVTTFTKNEHNHDSKQITNKLLTRSVSISDHNIIMNDTDRTIIGLLFHENVINVFNKKEENNVTQMESNYNNLKKYKRVLDNICLADYMDRITFQKQIWQFNEYSSLIKTMKNNNELFKSNNNMPEVYLKEEEKELSIEFTKVLTKYSSEFNNQRFVQKLTQDLSMDKSDMFLFFNYLRTINSSQEIYAILEPFNISKLEVERMFRFLNNTLKEYSDVSEDCVDHLYSNLDDTPLMPSNHPLEIL
jgi:SpoVK/Ycf46/Vps4 family AAA+-type ATPase